jgi:hypothetical protein
MNTFRKTALILLAISTMGAGAVAQTPSATAQAALPAAPKPYKPVPKMHDVIPTEMGCHVETSPGTLTKVDCLSSEEIAKYPPPAPCTGTVGDAKCGMVSTATPIQKIFGVPAAPITEAYVETTMEEYSSSKDTDWGKGAYSLQLNTNYFQAGPSNTGWVQFVYQDFASSARFCVWNIEWPNSSGVAVYSPVCTGMQPIPLTAKIQLTVGGFVCAGSCNYFRPGGTSGPAVMWGWISWRTLNANGSVCDSCSSGTVWAMADDEHGLAHNWTQVSGSTIGAGGGSELVFSGYDEVQNVLGATACPVPESDGWTCGSPQLDGQYADTAGWVTAEGNNLYYAPVSNWVIPEAPQSNLECSDGFCYEVAYELYPQ